VEGTCILPHRYDKERHPPQAETGNVCSHCTERHREHLTEIVELYAGLLDVFSGVRIDQDVAEHQHQKKAAAPPAPVRRLEAWVMLFDTGRLYAQGPRRDDGSFAEDYVHTATPSVYAVLAAWCDYLYEAKNWDANDVAATVAGCASTLSAYADFIAGEPWVDDFDAEIRWLRTALRRVHGLSDPRPVADCLNTEKGTECQGQVWRPEPDDGKGLRCDKCNRRYRGLDALRLKVHNRRGEKTA
jgi:hypothetical protein